MWTAIILLPLISSCLCDHRLSVLNGRGVRVVRISRLTSEGQCRQACQSPAAPGLVKQTAVVGTGISPRFSASPFNNCGNVNAFYGQFTPRRALLLGEGGSVGNRHCNWSVPHQNRCILLQCQQLSVCQNAGEQDIRDLLREIVSGRRETILLGRQRERVVSARVDQLNVENLFASTAWTRKIHLRHLLETGGAHLETNESNTIASSATTTRASTATAGTRSVAVVFTGTSSTAKASDASGGSRLHTEAMPSTASSPTSGSVPASTSSHVTELVTTTDKSGNSSSGSVLSPTSTSAPLSVISKATTQMPGAEQLSPAASSSTPRTGSPEGPPTDGAGLKTPGTTLAIPQDAVTSSTASTASTRATAHTPSAHSQAANPLSVVTSQYLEVAVSTATTFSSKSAALPGSTREATLFTTASTAETTGPRTKPTALTFPTTMAPADGPQTTASGLAGAQDTSDEYILIAAQPLAQYLVDRSSLLAVLLVGTVFFIAVIAVFLMQAFESYKKKDYTQVDYLINGMYVDSGM